MMINSWGYLPPSLSLSSSTDENEGRGSAWRNLCTPIYTYIHTRLRNNCATTFLRLTIAPSAHSSSSSHPSFSTHNYLLMLVMGENHARREFRNYRAPGPVRMHDFSSLSITHAWFGTWDADGRHILETRVRVATVVGCRKKKKETKKKILFSLSRGREIRFDCEELSFFFFFFSFTTK